MNNDLPLKYPLNEQDKQVLDIVITMLWHVRTSSSVLIPLFGEANLVAILQCAHENCSLDSTINLIRSVRWSKWAAQIESLGGFSKDQTAFRDLIKECEHSNGGFYTPVTRLPIDALFEFYKEHYPEDYIELKL